MIEQIDFGTPDTFQVDRLWSLTLVTGMGTILNGLKRSIFIDFQVT